MLDKIETFDLSNIASSIKNHIEVNVTRSTSYLTDESEVEEVTTTFPSVLIVLAGGSVGAKEPGDNRFDYDRDQQLWTFIVRTQGWDGVSGMFEFFSLTVDKLVGFIPIAGMIPLKYVSYNLVSVSDGIVNFSLNLITTKGFAFDIKRGLK